MLNESFLLSLLLGCLITGVSVGQDLSRYPLIPWPQALEARPGAFELDAQTRLVLSDPANEELQAVADFLAEMVRFSSGQPLPVSDQPAGDSSAHALALIVEDDGAAGAEGYRLSITPESVTITAGTPHGVFYGVQSLRQLMPPAVERGGTTGPVAETWAIPAVEIEDAPRFRYRGMHLDVARHFFPVSFVKKYIDLLAFYKLNRFHWHLTEDQGWRIEIERYPKLTEVGAFRKETLKGHYTNEPHQFDGVRYGGYYTQEEIREIVAYAQARYVTIIPEIEMPGHALAALAAYPELACTEGPFEVGTRWGIFEDIFCPTEETFTFLENVLTEVMDLFPGEYIHIGGDEAPKLRWEESEAAQEVIRREGLADEHELQSYFIGRIEAFLNEHGRKLIGWDEIVEGGLSPTATVMYWRDQADAGVGVVGHEDPARVAARQGNDLIMTPMRTLYLNFYQADPATEPLAIGGLITLEDVYAYEPIPEDFTDEEAGHVLGAQANLWTEYIKTPQLAEYMAFPRLLALSEVVWSQKEHRDWFSFKGRLPDHLERLDVMQVNYRRPDFNYR